MDSFLGSLGIMILPAVAVIGVFTFVSVAAWAENRRKEREAYYRSETLRKAIEQGGESSASVLAMMREEEVQRARRRIEGLRLGGLVTAAVGVGTMVFLYFLAPGEAVWLAGLIPFLIGIVLALYSFTASPPVSSDG